MTADIRTAGAASHAAEGWHTINWKSAYRIVCRLQARIVKAIQEGRWGKVKALQYLLTHSFSGKALAIRRVTENQGKGTPGVDREIWEGVIALVPGIMRLFWAFSSSNPPESPSQEDSSLANMLDTLEARCRSDGPPAGPRSIDPLPGSRSFLTVSAVA